jgi:ABC-2 type transport system ATP-binding protein
VRTIERVAPAIALHDLTKRYGSRRGVLDVTLTVERGEVFGFLGPNGAGKSTTIRTLLDLIRPSSGRAEVFGLDTRRDSVEIKRRIGYVPGELELYERLTAGELVEYFGHLRGGLDRERVEALAHRLALDLHRPIRGLSRGNKQKVALVQAFAHRPELLVLDEPTSGLDPLMQEVFEELVREAVGGGATVFLSSHVLSEVQAVADRVGIIREGRLVDVAPVEELRHRALRRFVVTFRGPAPRDELAAIPAVRDLTVDGALAAFRVAGSPDAVVKTLARHEVLDLTSTEPDLEEIFLAYYAGGGGAP